MVRSIFSYGADADVSARLMGYVLIFVAVMFTFTTLSDDFVDINNWVRCVPSLGFYVFGICCAIGKGPKITDWLIADAGSIAGAFLGFLWAIGWYFFTFLSAGNPVSLGLASWMYYAIGFLTFFTAWALGVGRDYEWPNQLATTITPFLLLLLGITMVVFLVSDFQTGNYSTTLSVVLPFGVIIGLGFFGLSVLEDLRFPSVKNSWLGSEAVHFAVCALVTVLAAFIIIDRMLPSFMVESGEGLASISNAIVTAAPYVVAIVGFLAFMIRVPSDKGSLAYMWNICVIIGAMLFASAMMWMIMMAFRIMLVWIAIVVVAIIAIYMAFFN